MRIGRESACAIEEPLALAAKLTGRVMLSRDIAGSRDVPRSFLAKIFQKLARSVIVVFSRGVVRGHALARRKSEINDKEILIAIKESDLINHCILCGAIAAPTRIPVLCMAAGSKSGTGSWMS